MKGWTLEARALSRRTAEGTSLLRDTSLRVAPGDRIGVRGASGTGKTVFLRALAGLDSLEGGELHWCGARVSGAGFPAYRRRAIYVHQRPALVEGTVEENLELPFRLEVNAQYTYQRTRAIEVLASLGKPESFLTKKQADLSGGEAQITALVRALLVDPALLLLDEPTASLDPSSVTTTATALRSWASSDSAERAIVCVSHDHAFLDALTTRRFTIRDAKLEEES